MKFKISSLILGMFFLSVTSVNADIIEKNREKKLESNILATVFLGDINFGYEKRISNRFSRVFSIDYIPYIEYTDLDDINTSKKKTSLFRTTYGIRTYAKHHIFDIGFMPEHLSDKVTSDIIGSFLELKLGIYNESNQFYGSFDFAAGHSEMFNESLYLEWKLGFSRILAEDATVLPILSVGVGFLF